MLRKLFHSLKGNLTQFPRTGTISLGVLSVCGVVMLLQLMYPPGRALPFVRVQGADAGGTKTLVLARQLEDRYRDAHIVLQTDAQRFDWPFREVGIDVDSTAVAQKATDYPIYKRLIPFSSLGIMLHRDVRATVRYDDERLNYFADQIQRESAVRAVNARITIQGDTVQLVSAKPSKTYEANSTLQAVRAAMAKPQPVMQVRLRPKVHQATRSDEEVKRVLALARQTVSTPLTLKVDNVDTPVDKATIASWLDFPEDQKTQQLSLAIKEDAVREYLGSIQPATYKAPGVTRVTLVDGKEVGRLAAAPGVGLDIDKATQSIAETLRGSHAATMVLPTVQYQPTLAYDRQYTDTTAGLTVLLNDAASARGNYAISVVELGNKGRAANANGTKPFFMTSTYKLYVAYAVLRQVETGQLRWTDKINGNQAADACFEAMVARSDNPCAEAFGRRIGWLTIERLVRAQGMTSTNFTTFYTTANDLALFLQKLYNGGLMSTASRERLLGAMLRQVYRSGIPAGTRVAVADKVGFMDGYLHDAGIAYGPKGPYVIVILSNGSSWAQLASAAGQIHAYLTR